MANNLVDLQKQTNYTFNSYRLRGVFNDDFTTPQYHAYPPPPAPPPPGQGTLIQPSHLVLPGGCLL